MNSCWLERLILSFERCCPFPICCCFNCQKTVLVVGWTYFRCSGGFTFTDLMELGNHSSHQLKSKVYPSPCISKLLIIWIYILILSTIFHFESWLSPPSSSFSPSKLNKSVLLWGICAMVLGLFVLVCFGFFCMWFVLVFSPPNKWQISKAG